MKERRTFLKTTLTFFAGIGILIQPLSIMIRSAFAQAKKIILPRGTKRESLINKNPAELDSRNLDITPLKEFHTMGLTDHRVDLNTWRLEIDGHVEKPLALTYEQITTMPNMERNVLLICPGFFANHGTWKGLSVKNLLEKAGWKQGTTHVTFRGPKTPNESLQRYPISEILSNKVFLAFQINGRPLPMKHGFPLRVVAEGYYGYDWIKYVYRVSAEHIAS